MVYRLLLTGLGLMFGVLRAYVPASLDTHLQDMLEEHLYLLGPRPLIVSQTITSAALPLS